jgi:hypothetical protein
MSVYIKDAKIDENCYMNNASRKKLSVLLLGKMPQWGKCLNGGNASMGEMPQENAMICC